DPVSALSSFPYLGMLISILRVQIDMSTEVSTQLGSALDRVVEEALRDYGDIKQIPFGILPPFDKDISVPQGIGNGGGSTVYRLREGIERFLITDINNPAASAQAQSSVWIMFDQLSTNPAAYNHIPGGSNVLYMDGHVQFQRYGECEPAPVNRPMADLVGILTSSEF
ncbi:MAG TPA: hypothetical protein PLA12_12110, partial [Candidatus Hydrogenedens sp.]|nr:hypothetical protein [Candidatus Hydrogenedens sp.]